MAKRFTRQQAINAMCRQCIYDPLSGMGNWRQQITACAAPECPLYTYRPVSVPRPTTYSSGGKTVVERGTAGRFYSRPIEAAQ